MKLLLIGGSGAFGFFETTKDISSLTKVRLCETFDLKKSNN